jgi:hypothetical protein
MIRDKVLVGEGLEPVAATVDNTDRSSFFQHLETNRRTDAAKAGLAIKKTHPKNPPKQTHPKKTTKNGFLGIMGFLKFLIFYENNTLFSLKQIFYEQIRHKLSRIYKKIVRYALN